jgi:hypothetical protein
MDAERKPDSSKKQSPTSYCQKCGAEVIPNVKFCSTCGASVNTTVSPLHTRTRENRSRHPDVLGLVSAGVILIILALTYIQYPVEPSAVISYIQRMVEQKVLIKPSPLLFDSVIFFVYAAGVWSIILSALRVLVQRLVQQALRDLVGGFFAFVVVHLLINYADDVTTGRMTLAYFIVAIGILIIVNTLIYFTIPKRAEQLIKHS